MELNCIDQNIMQYKSTKTSDQFGRYYTAQNISALLVKSMGEISPETVLDLGAGDGVLVGEAARVWKNSQFITVDIDRSAKSVNLPSTNGSAFKHHILDALDLKLADNLGLQWGMADAALCNPPYIRAKWRNAFSEIMEDAGLSHVFPKMASIPTDLLFIAQNLRMLKNGGRLGLILPDGIIAGEKYKYFRTALINQHCIERIIELPRGVFKKTDAKSHIVVISKNKTTPKDIIVEKLDRSGILLPAVAIPRDSAVKRMDYSYVSRPVILQNKQIIRTVVESISRGKHSSVGRKTSVFQVFHTTDFKGEFEFVPKEFLLKCTINVDGVIAHSGDILLARVGRNLSSKICMVKNGSVVVSDCIFILRIKEPFRDLVFRYLRSDSGRRALDTAAHGVSAKFLTTNALLDLKYN